MTIYVIEKKFKFLNRQGIFWGEKIFVIIWNEIPIESDEKFEAKKDMFWIVFVFKKKSSIFIYLRLEWLEV